MESCGHCLVMAWMDQFSLSSIALLAWGVDAPSTTCLGKKKSETSSAGEISMSFLVTLLAGDYPFAIALNPNVGLSYNATR